MSEANTDLENEVLPEPIISEDTPSEPIEVPEDVVPVEPAPTPEWAPDFKYKVMDEEHEIPEMYRTLIKDEDTLQDVRRLHEKAMGMPHLEKSRDEYKAKVQEYQPQVDQYKTVTQNMKHLNNFVAKGDFDTFFDALKIPQEKVLHWVKDKLDEQELPQEVQQQLQTSRQAEAHNYALQQEVDGYRTQNEQVELQNHFQSVQTAISSHAGDTATKYNQAMGNENAFAQAVIEKGYQMQQVNPQGPAPTPDVVVQAVSEQINKLWGHAPQAVVTPAPGANVINTLNKPAMPNIKTSGASPVKQPVRSLDDLKARYASM